MLSDLQQRSKHARGPRLAPDGTCRWPPGTPGSRSCPSRAHPGSAGQRRAGPRRHGFSGAQAQAACAAAAEDLLRLSPQRGATQPPPRAFTRCASSISGRSVPRRLRPSLSSSIVRYPVPAASRSRKICRRPSTSSWSTCSTSACRGRREGGSGAVRGARRREEAAARCRSTGGEGRCPRAARQEAELLQLLVAGELPHAREHLRGRERGGASRKWTSLQPSPSSREAAPNRARGPRQAIVAARAPRCRWPRRPPRGSTGA